MSKFLLVAINASYSHTNLAVRSIREYVKKYVPDADIEFGEWTINQPVGEVLRGIASFKPDFVLFSTYIWNGEYVSKIIPDIKKIIPDCVIGAGGPEFGFCAHKYLEKLPDLDFIMHGEGEETVREIVEIFGHAERFLSLSKDDSASHLKNCKSLYMRPLPTASVQTSTFVEFAVGSSFDKQILYTGDRPLICDLSVLPFPYPNITDPDNRMYYYESSRGCPFSCSYCMSSLDKRVRFMPLERVYEDLQRFLDARVRIVKFVDRTYNLQPERYISIWKYIVEHHNGKTMFHFEIEAEFLTEEALEFLRSVPAGVMQFEIGVQSANKETLRSVNRSENVEKLAQNIRQIPRTIHQHLDLIAGLPYENLESFGKSFDFVMALKPDALQLGFLKVLHGTSMEAYAKQNGWKWMENPMYETFSTPYMSYDDILFLKDVEVLVDAFYNSGVFPNVMNYIERNYGYWNFFTQMVDVARKADVFAAARREAFWFEFLACNKDLFGGNVLYELVRYDFIRTGKKGGYPSWYVHNYNKDEHRQFLENNGGVTNARLDFAYSDFEVFTINPESPEPEKTSGEFKILFKYPRKK